MSSKIEWTDEVWNPVTGCTRVSAGCDNCYAVRQTRRLAAMGQTKYAGLVGEGKGHFNGVVRCHEDELTKPLRWKRPRRVFVNSMSDLFHEAVPFAFVASVFGVIAESPQHTFQVLTKRPERMKAFWDHPGTRLWIEEYSQQLRGKREGDAWAMGGIKFPLSKVWLGVSVEDQATADARIPLLLQTPAAVRFVSYEPALGPVELKFCECETCCPNEHPGKCVECAGWGDIGGKTCWLCEGDGECLGCLGDRASSRLDWIIAGGESGPGARPSHPDWFRSVRDQCQEAAVPFFFKQWGEWAPGRLTRLPDGPGVARLDDGKIEMHRVGRRAAGRELDGRTWDEYPQVKCETGCSHQH